MDKNDKYEELRKRSIALYGDELGELIYQKHLIFSQHKLDDAQRLPSEMRKLRYPRRRERLLGSDVRYIDDSGVGKVLAYFHEKHMEKMELAVVFDEFEAPRESDLVRLKDTDVDFEKHQVTLTNKKEGGHRYTIPLKKSVEELLKHYMEKYAAEIRAHDGYVFFSNFPNEHRDHVSEGWVRNQFYKACKVLGLRDEYAISADGRHLSKVVFHSLRSHAVTWAWEQTGHNLKAASKLADHKDSRTTMTYYIKDKGEDLQKIMREI